jgi:ParB-like chromosome segregation protein Spo0J
MKKKLKGKLRSDHKAASRERRKPHKATNLSARKAVAPAPAPSDQKTVSYKVHDIAIAKIKVVDKHRALDPRKFQALNGSVDTIGLRTPITVRNVGGEIQLVAGVYRYEVAKARKWKTVPCLFIKGGRTIARMWQIAENLHRAELTALEEAEQFAEWVKLKESLEPKSEEKKNGPGRPEGVITKAANDLPVPGKTVAAKRKAIDRRLKIAGIDPEAKEAARRAGLDDSPTKLEKIAREKTPEARLAKVKELSSRKRDPSPSASPTDDAVTFEVLKREWNPSKKWKTAWRRANRNDRLRFITDVLKFPLDDE